MIDYRTCWKAGDQEQEQHEQERKVKDPKSAKRYPEINVKAR